MFSNLKKPISLQKNLTDSSASSSTFSITETRSYGDQFAYASACSVKELIRILEEISANLFNWFSNQIKDNETKCHLKADFHFLLMP